MAQQMSPRKGARRALRRTTQGMAVLGGVVLLASSFVSTPATAQTVEELKAQIAALGQRVDELETSKVATPVIAPAQAVTAGDFAGSIKIPGTNTSFKVGGYVKLDFFWTDTTGLPANSGIFGGTTVPVDGTVAAERGPDTRLTVYQTRFRIQTRTPSDFGQVRTYIETDFRGDSSSVATSDPTNSRELRLRHAYGTIGNLKTGQTWDNFLILAALADTVDFNGPRGSAGCGCARTPQVTYTVPFTGGSLLFSVQENAASGGSVADPSGTLAPGINEIPDFVARINLSGEWGTASLAGLVHTIDTDAGDVAGVPEDDEVGWGINLGGRINTFGKDSISASVAYLDGAGATYSATGSSGPLADALFNPATGSIENTEAFMFQVNYEHWWADNLYSILAYGRQDNDTDSGAALAQDAALGLAPGSVLAPFVEETQSVHVNLQWIPVPRVTFGIEYQYNDVETEGDPDGPIAFGASCPVSPGCVEDDGDNHRVQLMAKYSF